MQHSFIKNRSKIHLLCAGALIASLSGAAWAQTGASSGNSVETVQTDSGEIIVTARNYVPTGSETASKSGIPLIRTPQSVTVVSRDQIDLLNFTDAQQAVRYVAGVTGENYGPDLRFDFITVRGFTPRQFIDGLASPVTSTIKSVGVDLYAFESFEILKGPASVLYGSAPPGGIYNQVSRHASESFGGEIQAKYGMYDYKSLSWTVTGPVADGLSARVTGLVLDRDAERKGVDSQRVMVAPTFTWKLGETTSITGLGYYQYDEVNGDTNGFLPAVGTLLPNPLGQIDHRTNLGEPDFNKYLRRQWGVGWDAVQEIADGVSFRSNTKWTHYHELSRVIYGAGLQADNRTLNRFSFPFDEKVTSFASDNRLSAKIDTGAISHNFLAGVDYRQVHNVAAFGFGLAPTIDIFNPVYNQQNFVNPAINTPYGDITLKQTGVYAQDQLGFGNLYILLGGRYDWVKIANALGGTKTKDHKFTWRVGANYVFDNGFAPYIGYAKSFEPLIGTDSLTGNPFKPSLGRQIEGGVKFSSQSNSDAKFFATAALFDIKQTNVVDNSSSPLLPVFGIQNGEVKVRGGEIEIVARIREQLSINASYSYTDSEVTKNVNVPAAVGADLVTTPKHKASMFVDYTIQQGGFAGFGAGAGVRYSSRSAGSVPGPFSTLVLYSPGTTQVDAIVHYDTPGWRFAVNASNLLDKRYVARCDGLSNCNYGAGRQVIGTVTKKF